MTSQDAANARPREEVAERCYRVDTLSGPISVLADTPPDKALTAALGALAEAARRAVEADPDWPQMLARQEASRARNHARLHRLGLTDCQEDHT